MMEKKSSFRVKVDLSNFFNDFRKLGYVYVEKSIISHVVHLRDHIADVFKISEKFHLIADGKFFLPLNEDIRIIKEDENLTIIPESGYLRNSPVSVECDGSRQQSIPEKITFKSDGFRRIKEIEITESQVRTDEKLNGWLSDSFNKHNGLVEKISNHTKSIIGESKSIPPMISSQNLDDLSVPTYGWNSQADLSSHQSDFRKTRKRVRKRKSKREINEESHDSSPVSSSSQLQNSLMNKYDDSSTKNKNLSKLLSLKNTKIPAIFKGKKTRFDDSLSDVANEPVISNECQMETEFENTANQTKLNSIVKKHKEFENINPLDYPIYNSEFSIGDIVAFRLLIIGDDYTPIISGNIVAKISGKDCIGKNYELDIITGGDQLKTVQGKFSLEQDDTEAEIESEELGIVHQNWEDILEPRLIHRPET